jgi:hypothetical protein
MTGIGDDVGKFGQSQAMDLSHGANEQALGSMEGAAGQTQMSIAQNNTVSALMNAKAQAAMVAGAVKGLASVANKAADALSQ